MNIPETRYYVEINYFIQVNDATLGKEVTSDETVL